MMATTSICATILKKAVRNRKTSTFDVSIQANRLIRLKNDCLMRTTPTASIFFVAGGNSVRNNQWLSRHSVVSRISADDRCLSTLSLTQNPFRAWHNPNFLSNATLEEKEQWLSALLSSETQRATVDTEAYLIVLRALAQSPRPDAPVTAERWLSRLEQHAQQSRLHDTIPSSVRLTHECYRLVIQAWARAFKEDPDRAVIRGERWLTKHIDSPDPSIRPTTDSFNAFLDLCSKGRGTNSSAKSMKLGRIHAQAAERTLQYMIKERKQHGPSSTVAPTTESFNYVLRAWTRCRKGMNVADHVMKTLSRMEDYQASVDASVRPDSRSYAIVMDAISIRAKLKATDVRSRQSKDAWQNTAQNGLTEIQLLNSILDRLRTKADSGDSELSPSTSHFNTLISAWANLSSPVHPHAPKEAEKIFEQMIAMKDRGMNKAAPDSITYLMVVRAWSRSNDPNRGDRAQWWLDKQWKDFDLEKRADLQPNTMNYNAILRVWSDLGQPIKAEKVLSELIDRSNRDHDSEVIPLCPNAESFSFAIRAWLVVAEKGSQNALLQAVRLLDLLIDLEKIQSPQSQIVSMVHVYTGILGAARKCVSTSPDVLDVAIKTFDKLRTSRHEIHCLHYAYLLQVGLLALSRPENDRERYSFVKQLVQDCCTDGLVSGIFVRAIANGPVFNTGWTIEESARIKEEFFPNWPLPSSWTRNVKPKDFLPQESDLSRTIQEITRHGIDPYKGSFCGKPVAESKSYKCVDA